MRDGDLMASLATDYGEAVANLRQIERTAALVLNLAQAGVNRGAHFAVVGQSSAPVSIMAEARQAADVLARLARHLRAKLTQDQAAELELSEQGF